MSVYPPIYDSVQKRVIPPTMAARYGPLGANAWRAYLNKLGSVLNVQSVPNIATIDSWEEAKRVFIVPRNPSQSMVWEIMAPAPTAEHVVSAFTVQWYRLQSVTNGQDGKLSGLTIVRDRSTTVTVATDGNAVTYVQDHYQTDWCIAVVTAVTLSTGSLPFPANLGFTILYKSQ